MPSNDIPMKNVRGPLDDIEKMFPATNKGFHWKALAYELSDSLATALAKLKTATEALEGFEQNCIKPECKCWACHALAAIRSEHLPLRSAAHADGCGCPDCIDAAHLLAKLRREGPKSTEPEPLRPPKTASVECKCDPSVPWRGAGGPVGDCIRCGRPPRSKP